LIYNSTNGTILTIGVTAMLHWHVIPLNDDDNQWLYKVLDYNSKTKQIHACQFVVITLFCHVPIKNHKMNKKGTPHLQSRTFLKFNKNRRNISKIDTLNMSGLVHTFR
jgi:hypothetical protein